MPIEDAGPRTAHARRPSPPNFQGTAQAFQYSLQGLCDSADRGDPGDLSSCWEFSMRVSFIRMTILSGLPRPVFGALLTLMIFHLGSGPLRVRRPHHAVRHREKERDHDDRLRAGGAAQRRQERRGRHLRGLPAALSSDHDDHHGGAAGTLPIALGCRRGRRIPRRWDWRSLAV